MIVGHTKFEPDRVVGHIRQKNENTETLSLPQFSATFIDGSANASNPITFHHNIYTRDYKSGCEKLFHKLPGFREKFNNSIGIYSTKQSPCEIIV